MYSNLEFTQDVISFCLQRRKLRRINCTVRNATSGRWGLSHLNC